MAIVSERIQLARGTASQWTTANPTLYAGEVGWESDTNKFKIGDGATAWSGLPYANPSTALGSATPLVDSGSGSAGTSTSVSRQDHVHPTDTTRAPLASPALTGTPSAPTPTTGDNTTKIATTAFVNAEIAGRTSPSFVSYTSNGTFTKASYPGLVAVKVRVVGGGGGGGGAAAAGSGAHAAGAGGGAGGYAESIVPVANLAATETVTVGAPASGGSPGPNAGTAGNQSSFGSWAVGSGGTAGAGGATSTATYGSAGGAGGTGSFTGSGMATSGGSGGYAFGGAGLGVSGNGGDSLLGGGAVAVSTGTAGQSIPGNGASSNSGGGGSGGLSTSTGAAAAGGSGASGFVIVELIY